VRRVKTLPGHRPPDDRAATGPVAPGTQASEKDGASGETGRKRPSGAEAHAYSVGLMRGLKPRLPPIRVFFAACTAALVSL
jgi:hypothetical protein